MSWHRRSYNPLPASSKEFRLRTRQEILLNLNILILITLNNNPTGTQTCYNIAVLTTLSPLRQKSSACGHAKKSF